MRIRYPALPVPSLAVCAVAIAAVLPAQEPAADALPDGAALLDQMDEALRAAAKIDEIRSVRMSGTCELHIAAQEQPSSGRFEEYYEAGRSYVSSHFGDFHVEQGCDGEVVWEIDPMAGAVILEGDAAAAERRLIGLTLGDGWRKHYDAAKCIGTRTLGGTSCWVVRMKAKRGRPEIWYVARDEKRLAGIDMWKYSPGGASDCEVRFARWKAVDGIPYPFEMTAHVENAEVVFRYDAVVHNEDIPDERFALPDAIAKMAGAQSEKEAPQPLDVKIIELKQQPVASIRVETSGDKIGSTLAVAIPEIADYLTGINAQLIAPPFTRYHAFSDDGKKMDIEIGFPVARPIDGKGRIRPSTLPGGRIAEVWHIGHYQELHRTWEKLEKWFEENHHTPGARWEIYHTDPGREPDPSKWRTQIRWEIR